MLDLNTVRGYLTRMLNYNVLNQVDGRTTTADFLVNYIPSD